MAKYGSFKYSREKYGITIVPPRPRVPRYKVGNVLSEKILGENSLPRSKQQLYVVKNYNPSISAYTIIGMNDKYPRSYMEWEINSTFNLIPNYKLNRFYF